MSSNDVEEGSAGIPQQAHRWNTRFTQAKNQTSVRQEAKDIEIAELFHEPSLDEFMSQYFRQRPCLVKLRLPDYINKGEKWVTKVSQLGAKAASKKNHLVSVDASDPEKQNVESNTLLKKALNLGTAKNNVPSALRALSTKQMVAIRDPHSDDDDINAVREVFSRFFGCPVNTNLYMNKVGATGFIEHHDPHEVFAIQLHGMKCWSVGRPIVDNPSLRYLWRDSHVSSPEHMELFEVSAGQLMYIPIGWRHKAEPASSEVETNKHKGFSIHVTMGLQVPRLVDLLEQLVHEQGSSTPSLRSVIPFSVHEDGLHYELSNNALKDELQRLAEALGKINTASTKKIPGGAHVAVTAAPSTFATSTAE